MRLFLKQIEDMRTHYSRGNEHDRYLKIAGEGEARQSDGPAVLDARASRVKLRQVIPGAPDYVFGRWAIALSIPGI